MPTLKRPPSKAAVYVTVKDKVDGTTTTFTVYDTNRVDAVAILKNALDEPNATPAVSDERRRSA